MQERVSHATTKVCQNELERSMLVDVPVLSKIKLKNNLLPLIRVMKVDK